jgi:hypothetical protein
MPLVANMGRRFIPERLASTIGGAARRGKRPEAHAGHPFGADLYCGHGPFGAEHYCRKEPFGGDLYLNVDSDLLS